MKTHRESQRFAFFNQRFARLRWHVLCCICTLLCLCSTAVQAMPSRAFPVDVNTLSIFEPEDWGMTDPSALRFGVLSENSLGQSFLSRLKTMPPARSARGTAPPVVPQPPQTLTPRPNADGRLALFPAEASQQAVSSFQTMPRFGAFSRWPVQARADWKTHPALLSLQVEQRSDARSAQTGYGGLWVQWAPTAEAALMDARHFRYLSFWVQAADCFRLKVADKSWQVKGDALDLGLLSDFYTPYAASASPEGWRQVVLPLQEIAAQGIDVTQLAQWVIQADAACDFQTAQLRIRDPQLFQALPAPPLPHLPGITVSLDSRSATATTPRGFSTWVWNTRDLLADPEHRAVRVSELAALGVTAVYVQWPDLEASVDPVARFGALAELVKDFHGAGLRVYALDGDPRFILPAYREAVEQVLTDLAAYQTQQPPEAQFDGLHYDIEPYLLPGFFGFYQERLMQQYVDTVQWIYDRAQAMDLSLGLALPFWLDAPDEFSGQALMLEREGQNRPLYQWLQLASDSVAIMDYKTQVWGQNGILESVRAELDFAAEHQKKVIIALETLDLPDEQSFVFEGPPVRRLSQLPPNHTPMQDDDDALLVIFRSQPQEPWRYVRTPAARLSQSPLQSQLATAHEVLYWRLLPHAQVSGEQLSFARKPPAQLIETLTTVEQALASEPAFGGLAIHHSESVLHLLRGQPDSLN